MVKWDRRRSTGYNRIKWERGRFLLTGPADRSSGWTKHHGNRPSRYVSRRESASKYRYDGGAHLAPFVCRLTRNGKSRRATKRIIVIVIGDRQLSRGGRRERGLLASLEKNRKSLSRAKSVGGGAFMSTRQRGRPTSTASGCFRHADGNLAVPPFKWSWGVATCRRSASPSNSCAGNYSSWARESSTSRGRNRATWH